MASVNRKGYGELYFDGKVRRAHRVVLQLSGVDVPAERVVMHACDVPGCVNPDHMEVGTHRENMRDMVRKGRARSPVGDAHWTRSDRERARAIGRKNIVATHASGFDNTNAKVTPLVIEQVREANRANPGRSMKALGQPFGIGRETTRKIVKGIAPWKL